MTPSSGEQEDVNPSSRKREDVTPGAHSRGGSGGPWDLKNTRFSVFLPLNYVIFIFATRVLKVFALWKDRGSL